MNTALGNRPDPSYPDPGYPGAGEPPEEAGPPAAQAHPVSRRRYALLTMAACLLAVASGTAGAAIAVQFDGHTTMVASAPPVSPAAGNDASGQLARVAASVLPSIVTITVTTSTRTGEGSGVIIRSDGTILTNDHVIEAAAGGAGIIKVTFSTGRSADATLVGLDPSADLAVIRASGVTGLKPAAFGSASALHVGDTVLAIGSPLGLAGSVTSGIVSALHRTITLPSQQRQPTQSGNVIGDMIQTDTAINPGNSGGALVNDSGQVVGITTAIANTGGGYIGQQAGSIGIGFAIPADAASRTAARLMGS